MTLDTSCVKIGGDMARKYPSELNTRTIRVTIGDWAMLNDLASKANVTVAEAFHLVITEQARREQVTIVPRAQLRMVPITTPSIAVNGSKPAAFTSKPKGVRYE